MTLSSYSKWGTSLQTLYSDNVAVSPAALRENQPPLASNVFLEYAGNFDLLSSFLDPCYDSIGFLFYPENHTHLLPYFSSSHELLISHSPKTCPPDDANSSVHLHPKRQKCNEYQCCCSDFASTLLDGFVSSACHPVMDFGVSEVSHDGGGKVENERKDVERSASAQSIAARERRRKTTEKTQELGRLIPGGSRMNTAEMFHAAFKYVKFLQAQVGILESIKPFHQENKEASDCKELQIVLSAEIQEKLYLQDKCLVPTEPVKILKYNHAIPWKNPFSNLDQLITEPWRKHAKLVYLYFFVVYFFVGSTFYF